MRGCAGLISLCVLACAIALYACGPKEEAAAGSGGAAGAAGMMMTGGTSGASGTGTTGGSGGSGIMGTVSMESGGAPTFTAIYTDILNRGGQGNCTFGACHGAEPGPTNGFLKMYSHDQLMTYNALVNAPTSGICGTGTLVVPGHPEQSYLLQKVSAMPPCGDRMPVAGLGLWLSPGQIQQITTWIQNGAMND